MPGERALRNEESSPQRRGERRELAGSSAEILLRPPNPRADRFTRYCTKVARPARRYPNRRVILSAAKDLGSRKILLRPRSFADAQDDGGAWSYGSSWTGS